MQTILEITKEQAIQLWKNKCQNIKLEEILSINIVKYICEIKLSDYINIIISKIVNENSYDSTLQIIFNDYICYKSISLNIEEVDILVKILEQKEQELRKEKKEQDINYNIEVLKNLLTITN